MGTPNNKGMSFFPSAKPSTSKEAKELVHQKIISEAREVGSVVPVSIVSFNFDEPLRAVILRGSKISVMQLFIPTSAHDRVMKELENNKHFRNGIYSDEETELGKSSYIVRVDSKHWRALSAHLVDIGFNTHGIMFGIGDKADFNYSPSVELMDVLNAGAV